MMVSGFHYVTYAMYNDCPPQCHFLIRKSCRKVNQIGVGVTERDSYANLEQPNPVAIADGKL